MDRSDFMKTLLNNRLQIQAKLFCYSIFLCLIFSTSALAETKQSVTLSVSLDPALQDSLHPEHTLFVYARAAKGPRMPLAIVRHKAGELPLEVQLDASMAMMPQMSMTQFSQVVFLARISASGNAMTQAGDLLGQTAVVEWQKLDKPLTIVINKKH